MKRILSFVLVVVGLVGVAGPAGAAPPPYDSGTIPLTGTGTAGTGGYCPFDVRLDYVSHEKTTKTAGPDGSTLFHFTGNATATVTNVSSGKTLHYNISGPGTTTVYPDNSVSADYTGPFLLFTTVANSYSGVPQLAYTTGHVQFTLTPSGVTTSYHRDGNSTDVCAALA
ncbi:hypothetical protein ODJ79_02785 [Actinoplanes sp. KI2]|uniref:hypothetical protein n=1 Tax=Actinoplanes sp. KI2 TaxID=2983315 RepID=UPI0021D599BB|nr:hypothetical protein [Actinoplanes sp. KI2]MCU7722632.1 hypothetical protein [Actinoplanes sp. KI2]